MVLLCGADEIASWPLDEGGRIDLALIDELARLQLAARRLGYSQHPVAVPGQFPAVLLEVLRVDPGAEGIGSDCHGVQL